MLCLKHSSVAGPLRVLILLLVTMAVCVDLAARNNGGVCSIPRLCSHCCPNAPMHASIRLRIEINYLDFRMVMSVFQAVCVTDMIIWSFSCACVYGSGASFHSSFFYFKYANVCYIPAVCIKVELFVVVAFLLSFYYEIKLDSLE